MSEVEDGVTTCTNETYTDAVVGVMLVNQGNKLIDVTQHDGGDDT
jgi:hypothetical protein